MSVKITSLATGFFGLQLVGLLFSVINLRKTNKITLGAGGNKLLELRIRGHANFVETIPFCLFLTALIEYNQYLSTSTIKAMLTILYVARMSHAYAFMFEHSPKTHSSFRFPGFATTVGYIVFTSGVLVYHGIKGF